MSFGYSSEHAMAQAAKAIITAYYGKPPAYSYFEGCSDGGHEALADTPSCLTPAQVAVVRKYYLGPSDGHGHYLYPGGEPYGSELGWADRLIDPAADTQWPRDTQAYQVGINYLKYAAYWHNPPSSFQLTNFRLTVAAYDKLLPLAGIYDGTDPDLSAFHGRREAGRLPDLPSLAR